jgi:ParB family chromosome partitioning protein
MSFVENIARRQHRPIEMMQEIGSLHRRGYSDTEIAAKIGCTVS